MKYIMMLVTFMMALSAVAEVKIPSLEKHIGCYQTLTLDGRAMKQPFPISEISFNNNPDRKVFLDPESGKALPFYNIAIATDMIMNGKPLKGGAFVFTDRGQFSSDKKSIHYDFEGPVIFVKGTGPQGLLNTMELTETGPDTLHVVVRWSYLRDDNCDLYHDCPIYRMDADLKRVRCN